MARFVRFDNWGGIENLNVVQAPDIHPGPGQVRVRVRYAGLNPVDAKLLAAGPQSNPYRATLPSGNGNDYAGVIDERGPDVAWPQIGDRVFGGARMFAQADHVVVDAATVHSVPPGLTLQQAGGLDIAGRAAWASVASVRLGPDDTVLVSAAAGGVGGIAVQLAKRAGARVIGTAGADNHEYLRQLGVIPVAYGPGLTERVRALAPEGITAVLDYHGAETIDTGFELGVPGERINTIAAKTHRTGEGVTTVGGQAASPEDLDELARLIADGLVQLPIDRVYPIEQVQEAYRRLLSGHLRGKILLELGEESPESPA